MTAGFASLTAFVAGVFGDCLDHRHEQVGHCVWCATCNRKLYQGQVLTAEDIAALHEAVEWESTQ